MHSESWEDHYDFSSGIPIKNGNKEIVLDVDSLLTMDQITKRALETL